MKAQAEKEVLRSELTVLHSKIDELKETKQQLISKIQNNPKMNHIKIFDYEGCLIIFEEIDGKIMANATSMCMAFGKKPSQWSRMESVKNYIQAVVRKTHIAESELITTKNGGVKGQADEGTWIHERLILSLARWLSVDFEIWCDERIAELLRTGKVELKPKSETEQILDVIKLLNVRVEQEKAEKEIVVKQLVEAKPKVEYYDKVINSDEIFPITLIAQEANMSAVRLNGVLKEKKIQRRVNGTWVLASAYLNKGYAKIKTHTFTDSSGKERTNQQLNWTQKGKEFILRTLGLVGGVTG